MKTVIWYAVNKNNCGYLFANKPYRTCSHYDRGEDNIWTNYKSKGKSLYDLNGLIDMTDIPKLTWEDEPIKLTFKAILAD